MLYNISGNENGKTIMKNNETLRGELEKYMCGSKNIDGYLAIFCQKKQFLSILNIIKKHGYHITKNEKHNCFRYVMTDISYSIMGEEKLPFF